MGAPKSGKSSVIKRFSTGEWEEGGAGGEGGVKETVVVRKHNESGKVFEFTMLDFGSDVGQVDVSSLKGCHAVVAMMSLLVQVGIHFFPFLLILLLLFFIIFP